MFRPDLHNIKNVYQNMLLEQYYNDQLDPDFWQNGEFNPLIRQKLLEIAENFYEKLKLDIPISDIQLTGSLANYTYTEYSDLDVHIIIDFSKINNDVDLVKKALDGVRFIWNLRHQITIKGHEVELYLQDTKDVHDASGLYSLLENKWLRKPQYNPPEIDERSVELKFNEYVKIINQLDEKLNQENLTPEELKELSSFASQLRDKVQKERQECLNVKREGEFCVENLVFKKLRNNGYIERLIHIANSAYDKIYTESF
jgi:predicted nucleotidyltransferase